MKWRLLLLAVLSGGGCTAAAADHERLGDRAYREGRFAGAVAEYRAAAKSGGAARVYAKLGSAALHAADLPAAVAAYLALKEADPARAVEAASGLERVALAASRSGEAGALALSAAVRAIRQVTPGRPLGRFGLVPTRELDPSEAVGALAGALASAPDARGVDSLLVAYGEAQRVTTACEAATHTFGVVLRRSHNPAFRATAANGIAACALRLGLDALAGEQTEAAEKWFETAVQAAPASPSGWRAAIGLGDARMGQGDLLGAAIAYQSVLSATGVPDSLTKQAAEKLNALSVPHEAL